MKPGIHTTEFWITAAYAIISHGLALAYAISNNDIDGAFVILGATISTAIQVREYIMSRTAVKVATSDTVEISVLGNLKEEQ